MTEDELRDKMRAAFTAIRTLVNETTQADCPTSAMAVNIGKIDRHCLDIHALSKIYDGTETRTDWVNRAVRYEQHCTRCGYGIKPNMVTVDGRLEGQYHPGCKYKALKERRKRA